MSQTIKRDLVSSIEALRAAGASIREISAAVGRGKSQVQRYIAMFQIKRGQNKPKCPHCGVDLEGFKSL